MVKNNKGWLRILEATIAITIFSSVLLIIYSQQTNIIDNSETISILQDKIISEISNNNELRNMILSDDEIGINTHFRQEISLNYYFNIRICNLSDPVEPCKMYDYTNLYDKEIFVESTIVSGNLTYYNPKLVNIFMWL